jgi:AraC-like DNA-binding protein
VYVLAGQGRYQDENALDLEVRSGDIIQLQPNLGHAYGPDSDFSWVERYIVFEGPVFSLWEETGLFDIHQPVVHLSPVYEWNRRIDHLFGASGQIGTISAMEEICRLQVLLAKIHVARQTGGRLSSEDGVWLSAACALLSSNNSHADDISTLRSIANSLSLSYDGFRKRFRRLAGISPGRYRAYQQINRACEMLQSDTMTNREIAHTLGFKDEAHFSKRFKQIRGRSPRSFKAMLPRARHNA